MTYAAENRPNLGEPNKMCQTLCLPVAGSPALRPPFERAVRSREMSYRFSKGA
jgi:hypothetical protein